MAQKFPIDSEWFFKQLKARGKSLRRFATDMGMDASALSRMFNGSRNMSAEEQDRIAALLGLTLEEISAHRGHSAGGFGEMGQAGYEASGSGKKATLPATVKDKEDPYRHPIFGCMAGTITVMPGVDLTESLVTDDDFDWNLFEDE